MMRIPALVALLAIAACSPSSKPAPPAAAGDSLLEAFAKGDLDGVETQLRDSRDPEMIHLRARALLLRNRNREAADLLRPLLQEKSQNYAMMERQRRVFPDLANAYVRLDDFRNAAVIYGFMGENILARKFERLGRTVAYTSNLADDEISIDLVATEPLPVIAGTVNGRRTLFVIDTLLDEVVLDAKFAEQSRVEQAGPSEATVQELGLGRAVVRTVPVHLGEAMKIGELRPDGAIGLQFLMHFDFTLDYRRSKLILRKAGGPARGQPAYLAGDRYLLTGATVNGKDPAFVAIGTSLKGVTLGASEYLVQAQGDVREFASGPIKLVKPTVDLKAFPAGLDQSFGLPVGYVLGNSAFRGRVLRLEPRSMKLSIE